MSAGACVCRVFRAGSFEASHTHTRKSFGLRVLFDPRATEKNRKFGKEVSSEPAVYV